MANDYNNNAPNTAGRIMRNYNSEQAKFAIRIDYWKDSVKISFCPKLNEKTEYGDYKYAFDTFSDDFKREGVSILLRSAECLSLYNDFEKYIVPAINGLADSKTIGVSKNDSLFTINPNKGEDGVYRPKLVLYTKIDPTTMKCDSNNIFEFEFNVSRSIVDYDPNTGNFQTYNNVSEFNLFMSDMKCLAEGTSMAYVHAAATHDKWYNNLILDKINAIVEKNGIPVANRRGFNGAGGKGDIFSKSSSQDMVPNDEAVSSLDQLNI